MGLATLPLPRAPVVACRELDDTSLSSLAALSRLQALELRGPPQGMERLARGLPRSRRLGLLADAPGAAHPTPQAVWAALR